MRTAPFTTAGVVLLAAGLITSCSGGSSGSSAAKAGSGSGAQASAIAQAVGAGSSVMDSSKKACDGIKPADVQALLKASASAVTVNPFECAWNQGAITVTVYLGDTTDKYYNDQASNAGPDGSGSLSVGDKAVWFQPVPGRTVPAIVSHEGSNTCVVQLSADPPDTTVAYTGSAPFFTVKPADAEAYAAKEGQLCTEVFSALG
jgi:hypothetical protein